MAKLSCMGIVLLTLIPFGACGDGFLEGPSAGSVQARRDEFRAAMGSVMGCGSNYYYWSSQIHDIEQSLAPIWRVLPKNADGRVEWRMLRYAVHRYFMQRSSLLIRGFEPARQVNSSHLGGAEILNTHAPSLMQQVLEGKAAADGFSLEDVAAMVATLERLVFDAESGLITEAFKERGVSLAATFSHKEFEDILESYMIHWFLGNDQESIDYVLQNRSLLPVILPHWHDILNFTSGMIRSMEYNHYKHPLHDHRHGHQHDEHTARIALLGQYSFGDVHEVVGSITRTFAQFWEAECQTIKKDLSALDRTGTGRVSLSDFYGANADGEWRFGESEAYLRELGALDETSSWRGKQVIIPNYLQGASNCIVATANYLVCCTNECESILNDVEDHIGAPVGNPDEILAVVRNITGLDDEEPKIDKALVGQLWRIAESHGGQVPLHGRLFAQWLHYVFPRECPFPHRSGTVSSIAPLEFGDDFIASDADVHKHAAARGSAGDPSAELKNAQAEAQWMTQWSEEEELHADYSLQLRAPWERGYRFAMGGAAAVVALVLVWTGVVKKGGGSRKPVTDGGSGFGFDYKSHFV